MQKGPHLGVIININPSITILILQHFILKNTVLAIKRSHNTLTEFLMSWFFFGLLVFKSGYDGLAVSMFAFHLPGLPVPFLFFGTLVFSPSLTTSIVN